MELGMEVAGLVIASRGAKQCGKQLLQRAQAIIQAGSPLSIYTFVVHRQCQQKFAQCTNALLIEIWTITILSTRKNSEEEVLDGLFLKNAVRSHLHFSQLSSWIASNGGELPHDTVCEYRISLDGSVGLSDQLSNLEIHNFPVGRIDTLSSFVYVTVRWRKLDSAPNLLHCPKFPGLVTDEWLLPSQSSSIEDYIASTTTSVSTPTFYLPTEYRQNEQKWIEFEDIARKIDKVSKSVGELESKPYEQSNWVRNQALAIESGHVACSSPHLHSDPRICQFFNYQKGAKVENESVFTDSEQIIGSPVIESLSEFLSSKSSKNIEFISQSTPQSIVASRRESMPRRSLIASAFRFMSTASKAFSKTTGLPLNSSPAPFSRNEMKNFDKYPKDDAKKQLSIKKKIKAETQNDLLHCVPADVEDSGASDNESICTRRSTSSSNGLLCNFEESALNGRLEPVASLDGFRLQIAASGVTCSPHLTLPVTAFFFNMTEDETPLPYLGLCSLEHLRRGYRIPKKGNIQVVLFNPQGTVVRMFLVKFDVTDMPPSSQTFLRQRTFFMPVGCTDDTLYRSQLKYLIHLSLATDRRGRLYMHTDIRMLFSQKSDLEMLNVELGRDLDKYQLQSFTEMPRNPKYSSRE